MAERVAAILEDNLYLDPAGRWIIRPYRPGDEQQILSLFRRVFGVDRTLEHWRWKFQENPAGQQIVLAVANDGGIIAQHAGLPVRVAKGEQIFLFVNSVDCMVDSRFRQGLKRPGLMVSLVLRHDREFMGQGPDKGAIGYGFPIPMFRHLLNGTNTCRSLHPVIQLGKDFTGSSVDRMRTGTRGGSWRYRIERVARLKPSFDRLWHKCRQEFPLAAVRDAQYLNWRYADCPDVTYAILVATDRLTGRSSGAVVLRLGLPDRPVALLMDWLVPSGQQDLAQMLLDHCHALAMASGLQRIEAWFPEYTAQFHFLRVQGYEPVPTMYHLIARQCTPELSLEWISNNWYYTMGDSDIF